jgi:hypothetical protein
MLCAGLIYGIVITGFVLFAYLLEMIDRVIVKVLYW